jgi:hypothetical protein
MSRWLGWLAAAWIVGAASIAWACPGCKEALFDPGEIVQRVSTARGYALSIGLLLGVPASMILGITALIVRSRRKSAQTRIDTPKLSR